MSKARLLLITDGFGGDTVARVDAALGALPRGAAVVQLRAKMLGGRELYRATLALRAVTGGRAQLVVNDRADVALAAGADGVHLPASGLAPDAARRAAAGEEKFLIGASTHSLEELRAAVRGGADYVTFGPVYATTSKAAFGAPVGVERLRAAVAEAGVPVFALGGVDAARAAECARLGARVACIGAVLGHADPAAGARALWAALGENAPLETVGKNDPRENSGKNFPGARA